MFTLPDLPYDYNALEPFIDEETMHLHHEKHHATYVKNLNDILEGHKQFLEMDVEQLLKSLDQVPGDIHIKVKNNAGGHYNHSIFWKMMTAKGGEPSGELLKAINTNFENYEKFKNQFTQTALGVFGSGWAWLVWDKNKLLITSTPNQDSPISQGQYPILGLDVWEHAYYLKYNNRRAEYIEAWWQVLNWEEITKRFGEAQLS